MVGWRLGIHWILGHPELGERILIVGSGPFAVEIARETLGRPDAGFRVVGFVDSDPELVGKSLINPKVIGLTSDLRAIVKKENIDRIGTIFAATPEGERKEMPIHQYSYKDDPDSTMHVGPMAQDVEKVDRGAVKKIGGVKHIDTRKVMGSILRAA